VERSCGDQGVTDTLSEDWEGEPHKRKASICGHGGHTCDPGTQEAKAGGPQVPGYLGYIVRPVSKKERKKKTFQDL
jgi:hypothetical protein